MELCWLAAGHPDRQDVAGAAAVLEAVRLADSPHQIWRTTSALVADLTHGWDGDPSQGAVARDEHGRVRGVLLMTLPTWDNRHLGYVEVFVDPERRRRGVGRALFDAGVERIRTAGRTTVLGETWDLPHCVAFAKAMGLDRASDAVARRQDIASLDAGRLDRLHADARERAAEYELVRLAGPVPEDLAGGVVELTAAINDAPIDDLDIEDEVFSAERVRAFERVQDLLERRIYRVMARHRRTGELAGHTVVAVEGLFPWHAHQYDTSVLRAHRGHRLGLLLKADMLRWLAEQEPQLRALDTWNAASNDHMIEVNELLGYHVLAHAMEWQRRL